MDNRPSLDQLNKDLKELKYVTSVSKKYNVSNLCIYKWIKNYEKYNLFIKTKPNVILEPLETTLIEKPKDILVNEPMKEPKLVTKKEHMKETKLVTKKEHMKEPKLVTKKEPIKNPSPNKNCIDCKIPIYYKSTRCNKCLNMNKIKEGVLNGNRPTLEQLNKDLEELKSYVKVGEKYNVSDNCIRKWIKRYDQCNIVV
jgi:transposase-like protein